MSGVKSGKQCTTGIPPTYLQTGNSNDNIQLGSVNACAGEFTIFYNNGEQVRNTAERTDNEK